MKETTIHDYIGGMKELTAAQVRKLPIGASVMVHSFDRWGNHQTREGKVIKSGKKTMLRFSNYWDGPEVKEIRKETDRMCYTEVTT